MIIPLAKLFHEKLSRVLEKSWEFVSEKGYESCYDVTSSLVLVKAACRS